MIDVIGEVYGKKIAKQFVFAGALVTIFFLLWNIISVLMPWLADGAWAKDSYNTIFGISVRMSVASLLAFVIAEYQDVFTFFLFKKKFGEKRFWLLSNISNVWSQFLDTTIWTLVAFLGVYSFGNIVGIIIPWFIYKVLMGVLYTPVSYLGIYL